jgi:hypothetical protein
MGVNKRLAHIGVRAPRVVSGARVCAVQELAPSAAQGFWQGVLTLLRNQTSCKISLGKPDFGLC